MGRPPTLIIECSQHSEWPAAGSAQGGSAAGGQWRPEKLLLFCENCGYCFARVSTEAAGEKRRGIAAEAAGAVRWQQQQQRQEEEQQVEEQQDGIDQLDGE